MDDIYEELVHPVLLDSLNELVKDGIVILEVDIPSDLLRHGFEKNEYKLPVDISGSGVDPERISVYDAIERNDFYDIVYDICKTYKNLRRSKLTPPKSFYTDRPWELV